MLKRYRFNVKLIQTIREKKYLNIRLFDCKNHLKETHREKKKEVKQQFEK